MKTTGTTMLLLCALAASSGCGGLLSKGDPGDARYFNLEQARATHAGARAEGAELRLGRVTGATHLEDRLVFRDSAYEIGYHRELRWTEPPELSLKRQLARELFEERGLRHAVGGDGPSLDVQLTALDELRAPLHLARARVTATLHDEQVVLWEETLTVERPIIVQEGGDVPRATVEALGEAMQGVIEQVADRVVRELGERR